MFSRQRDTDGKERQRVRVIGVGMEMYLHVPSGRECRRADCCVSESN